MLNDQEIAVVNWLQVEASVDGYEVMDFVCDDMNRSPVTQNFFTKMNHSGISIWW